MSLLSRYILRQLTLPFLFGLLALTGVMLLNVIGRKFGALVGKGLGWEVIGEVFLLSLPFILAMTLPLAVLVATLYTFSQLTSDNEVTAMRAGGVSTMGLLRPVLGFAAVMALVSFLFNDQVLPRANVRLRNLYFDIGRKKPTFSLDEQVINPIPPSSYFLRASRIDPGSGRMRSVTIYDIGLADRRRIIYADSGVMGYTPDGRDLVLRLYRGSIQQVNGREPAAFQHTAFTMQEIRVGDVFDELERSTDMLERGDREMNTCELLGVVDSARWERRAARERREGLTRADLRFLVGLEPGPVSPPGTPPSGPYEGAYCGLYRAVGAMITRETAPDSSPAQPAGPTTPPAAPSPAPKADRPPAVALPAGGGATLPRAADSARAAVAATTAPEPPAPAPPLAAPGPPPYSVSDGGAVMANAEREKVSGRRAARYMVEVHKKWALATACFPFVLVAVALALRFPRGGMGLVIGGAMFVYSISYVGLTAGESLADRGYVPPGLAMWAPNIILSALAALGLWLVHRESGSTRGGDLGEIGDFVRRLGRRLVRGRRPQPA